MCVFPCYETQRAAAVFERPDLMVETVVLGASSQRFSNPLKTAPTAGELVLKHVSLRGTFHSPSVPDESLWKT